MKRAAVILALAATAAAALPARYFYESQSTTRDAPTLATEGMGLHGVTGFRVSICAESGQTLSGTGNLRAYLYHTDAALWMRNPDLDLAVDASSVRCQAFPDMTTGTTVGHRVLFAADTVGVSGGTTVTVRIDGPPL